MAPVEKILASHFPAMSWDTKKSPAGLSKESYIAESGDRKVFIKFDVETPALQRLAEIGATPQILFIGKKAYRIPMEENRIFWWTARASLTVAIWFDRRKDWQNATSFLEDFMAAALKEKNPKLKR